MTSAWRSAAWGFGLACVLACAALARGQSEAMAPATKAGAAPAEPVAAKVSDKFWAFPEGTLAWWAVGPDVGYAAGDLVRGATTLGLRALGERALDVREPASEVWGAVLRPSVLGGAAYRVALLDVGVSRGGRGGTRDGLGLSGLEVVIEIRAPKPHDRLERAIQNALLLEESPGRVGRRPVGQATIARLGEDVEGLTYVRGQDPAWREVSWCSTPDAFVVAIGRGALPKWFAAKEAGAKAEWLQHVSAVRKKRGGVRLAAGAFVDVSGLRARAPEAFLDGPLPGVLAALQSDNARSLMVCVMQMPTDPSVAGQLLVEAAWSSRAEPPGLSRTRALAGLTPTPGQGTGAPRIELQTDWGAALAAFGDVYVALSSARAGAAFERERQTLVRRAGPALQRVVRSMDRVIIGAEGAGASATAGRVLLKDASGALEGSDMLADLRQVMAATGAAPVFDPATRSWSMTLPWPEGEDLPRTLTWKLNAAGTAVEARVVGKK